MRPSSSASSQSGSINGATHRLRQLQEERDEIHLPSGFVPGAPHESHNPLKSHPGLALSPNPPPVPEPGPISPVNLAGTRGFSRSGAGLSWEHTSLSLSSPADSSLLQPKWSPFRTEYMQKFSAHQAPRARLLNHARIKLEGASSFKMPSVDGFRPFSQPFGNARIGGDSAAFQASPRGQALGQSYPDNTVRNSFYR